jgi:hypothetical protein
MDRITLNRRTALALLGVSATSWPACAAEPWRSKPPAKWSARDWRKLLNDSPWARNVQTTLDQAFKTPVEDTPPPATGGCCIRNRNSSPDSASVTPEAPARLPERSARAFIRCRSARPIRLAILHSEPDTRDASIEQITALAEPEAPAYVIEVVLPRVEGQRSTSAPAAEADLLRRGVSLRCPGHGSRAPIGIALPGPGNPAHVFYFSRTPAITLADKQIEFTLRFGLIELKHTFALSEMVYLNRLEL